MKHKIIPYRAGLKDFARKLRHKMTLAEVLLWQRLKRKQLCGYDFDRQKPSVAASLTSIAKSLALRWTRMVRFTIIRVKLTMPDRKRSKHWA